MKQMVASKLMVRRTAGRGNIFRSGMIEKPSGRRQLSFRRRGCTWS
jgi:hypothetical protein